VRFTIEITPSALAELKAIRTYYRRTLVDAIDEQHPHEPTAETKNRKKLVGLAPDFEHIVPIWELRVGDYRVFDDVDEEKGLVVVRAVREKRPHLPTEEVV